MISTVGERLRRIREGGGLSLKEVANSIGIDTSLLGKIERSERQATRDQIKQLSTYYSIDEGHLLKELLSDQIVYKILGVDGDLEILKVAEQKIEYYKNINHGNEH